MCIRDSLLREGLDIPEITLVAILDADKEGFLRSETSLIQTVGRAARNADGRVIMYADTITDSMRKAIDETERRRRIQQEYNEAVSYTHLDVYKRQVFVPMAVALSVGLGLLGSFLSLNRHLKEK